MCHVANYVCCQVTHYNSVLVCLWYLAWRSAYHNPKSNQHSIGGSRKLCQESTADQYHLLVCLFWSAKGKWYSAESHDYLLEWQRLDAAKVCILCVRVPCSWWVTDMCDYSAFFESVKGVGTFVGSKSLETYILPLMVQSLAGKWATTFWCIA